jgi:anti-sigma factor RsiW
MTNSNMTCEAFDAALPDYLEGTLAEPLRTTVAKHLSECVRCASLVRDLEKIQRDAAALPDLVPSRDLWQGIEARIAAPVIPLAARPERQRRFVPAWMGVAAAALIVSTAGITYMLTARSIRNGNSPVATLTPSAATQNNSAQTSGGTDSGAAETSTTNATEAAAPAGHRGGMVLRVPRSTAPETPVGPQVRVVRGEQSEVVYGREIEMLQKILTDRKSQLDSSTVAIIERNLRIIDAAIEQSKTALAKDPASRLLSDQLTHALDKKVELLRTAALLPAST